MQSSATVPATIYASTTGSDPGFVNRAARDLHLTGTSACRNWGLNALLYLDGTGATHSGLPTLEYVNHLKNRTRPSDGQTDLGAYEYRVPAFSAIRLSGNDCLVDFTTASGNQYNLQSTSNLAGNFWSPVSMNIQGMDGIIRITDTNAITQARKFYRLQAYP